MTLQKLRVATLSDDACHRPKRLVMILPHLGAGGAQRVAVNLANYWAEQGLQVFVVTTLEHKADFYALSPLVQRKILKKARPVALPVGVTKALALVKSFVGWSCGAYRVGRSKLGFDYTPPQLIETLNALYRGAIKAVRSWRKACIDSATLYCIKSQMLGKESGPYLRLLQVSLWRVSALRALLDDLDANAVVSFLGATNMITIAATRGLSSRVVISERNDPALQQLDQPWEELRPLIYPVADVVTANSHGALDHMQRYCPVAKLAYVPNPIFVPVNVSDCRSNSVLFLARLVHQKGPDILIELFAQLARENPDWSLQIAGAGPMDQELMARIRELGIANRVTFHGLVRDPTELLASSRVFVLPSRFEGTPNSLLEAMAAKLACVVSDASPGPLRLIEHGVSGLVVKANDVDDLTRALRQLTQDAALIERLAQAGRDRIDVFRIENVTREWERLLFPDA